MLIHFAIAALSLAAGGFSGYRLKKFDIAAAEQRIANYRGWVKLLEQKLTAAENVIRDSRAGKVPVTPQKPIVFGKGSDL